MYNDPSADQLKADGGVKVVSTVRAKLWVSLWSFLVMLSMRKRRPGLRLGLLLICNHGGRDINLGKK